MLAIDIETASPDVPSGQKPDFRDTSDFELVAIALGYRDESDEIHTNVFFRQTGFGEPGGACMLMDEVIHYISHNLTRDFTEPTLTYNGEGFDRRHMSNWAEELNRENSIQNLFQSHIDLCQETRQGSLETVCRRHGISTPKTYYDNYNLPAEVLDKKPDNEYTVKGSHIGEFLGEEYIKAVEKANEGNGGLPPAELMDDRYRELTSMISDYAKADIEPLFELYDAIQDAKDNQTTL